MYSPKEAEGTKRRHQVDTVVEGMYVYFTSRPKARRICYLDNDYSGLNRLTKNLEIGLPHISTAFRQVYNLSNFSCSLTVRMNCRVTDAEAVSMARYVVQHDGLFLGSSSACNLVACVKLVKEKGWAEGQRVVTIL